MFTRVSVLDRPRLLKAGSAVVLLFGRILTFKVKYFVFVISRH